jgi:hypothetical protein
MYEEQREHNYANLGATYLKHRTVVAEWMVDVCDYFNLHPTTTHLAVAFLDRIQPNDKFSRFEWQMLAICCIIIASKYNECESHVPDLSTLEEITHQSIPNASLLSYELWTLKRMGWKLHGRTPMSFLASFLSLGVVFPADRYLPLNAPIAVALPDALLPVVSAMLYLCSSLCLTQLQLKPYLASDQAAAMVYIARRNCRVVPVWCPELALITGFADVAPLAVLIELFDLHLAPVIARTLGPCSSYLPSVVLPGVLCGELNESGASAESAEFHLGRHEAAIPAHILDDSLTEEGGRAPADCSELYTTANTSLETFEAGADEESAPLPVDEEESRRKMREIVESMNSLLVSAAAKTETLAGELYENAGPAPVTAIKLPNPNAGKQSDVSPVSIANMDAVADDMHRV